MLKNLRVLQLKTAEGETIDVLDGDVVGRRSIGAEVLGRHSHVSRRHAQFMESAGTWYVIDLGSDNGTYVQNTLMPAGKPVRIKNRHLINLSGKLPLTVTVPGKEAALKAAGRFTFKREPISVMFVDLKGSTKYTEAHGAMAARNWMTKFYKSVGAVVKKHSGLKIKHIGDATLSIFPNGLSACRAAMEIQRTVPQKGGKDSPYAMRVAISSGKLIYDSKDVFGTPVNIASRLQDLTPAGRIYLSGMLYNNIKNTGKLNTKFIALRALKGIREKKKIYELLY